MEHTKENTMIDGFDLFQFIMDNPPSPVKEPAPPAPVMYSDLEIACFLAHKRGEYGPMMTFITNDHPLMVEAGITHDLASMHGKIVHRFN